MRKAARITERLPRLLSTKRQSSDSASVVKVGGAHLDNPEFLDKLAAHLRELVKKQGRTILVHGGGKEIAQMYQDLSLPVRKELGLRVTCDDGMRVVTMVLCGLVNKRLVGYLNEAGIDAVGVCGADAGVMRADFVNYEKLGRVGGAPRVNAERLDALRGAADVLVFSPVCMGPDKDLVNVNADVAAQAIAVAFGANRLEYVTDVDGVRAKGNTIRKMSTTQVEQLVGTPEVGGGMVPKLQATVAALGGGVEQVLIGSLSSLAQGTATQVHA